MGGNGVIVARGRSGDPPGAGGAMRLLDLFPCAKICAWRQSPVGIAVLYSRLVGALDVTAPRRARIDLRGPRRNADTVGSAARSLPFGMRVTQTVSIAQRHVQSDPFRRVRSRFVSGILGIRCMSTSDVLQRIQVCGARNSETNDAKQLSCSAEHVSYAA